MTRLPRDPPDPDDIIEVTISVAGPVARGTAVAGPAPEGFAAPPPKRYDSLDELAVDFPPGSQQWDMARNMFLGLIPGLPPAPSVLIARGRGKPS